MAELRFHVSSLSDERDDTFGGISMDTIRSEISAVFLCTRPSCVAASVVDEDNFCRMLSMEIFLNPQPFSGKSPAHKLDFLSFLIIWVLW